jgi:hypothetical protein
VKGQRDQAPGLDPEKCRSELYCEHCEERSDPEQGIDSGREGKVLPGGSFYFPVGNLYQGTKGVVYRT